MSSTRTPTCALNISAETLSNYRDATLAPAERERIAQHLRTCDRCQKRLAGYERAAMALRAERVPVPDGRLWRGVQAGMTSHSRARRMPPLLRLPSRQVLSGLGAVAAVLLLVVGFAQLLHRAPSKGTVVPLVWTHHTLPQDVTITRTQHGAFAPVGVSDAYACGVTQIGTGGQTSDELRIYVTHDQGTNWTTAAKLANFQSDTRCAVLPDENNPSRALVVTGFVDANGYMPYPKGNFQLTTDGGKTWTHLSTGIRSSEMPQSLTSYKIEQYATIGNTSLVLVSEPPNTQTGTSAPIIVASQLLASSDGMQTWHITDGAITTAGQYVQRMMVGVNGTLYAQTGLNNGTSTSQNSVQLWTSTDSGQSWTHLTTPSATEFIVRTAGTATTLCALTPNEPISTSTISTVQFTSLVCSTDGGKTWTNQNIPDLPAPSGGTSAAVPGPAVLGYLSDGALLGQTASGSATNYTVTLYALEPGSQTWQSLGALPAMNFEAAYVATPAPGGFWAYNFAGNASNDIFTADYTASPQQPKGQALTWTKTAMDAAGGEGHLRTIAPTGDGTSAYACEPTQANGRPPSLFVTHDSGATWSMVNKVPMGPANACYVVADPNNPQVALLAAGNAQSPPQGQLDSETLFATTDGGQSLHQMSAPSPVTGVVEFAQWQRTTYLFGMTTGSNAYALYSSTDGTQTWSLDLSSALAFWIGPDGTLYAEVSITGGNAPYNLTKSIDGGKTWTDLPAPSAVFFVAHPALTASGQPTFCAVTYSNIGQFTDVSCSDGGGQTWANRVVPALPQVRDKAQLAKLPRASVIGVDDSGALLAFSDSISGSTFVYTLQRLPVGASAWESLGPLPAGILPDWQHGIPSTLWEIPASKGPAYTATYPFTNTQPTATTTAGAVIPTATPLNVTTQGWQQATLPATFTIPGNYVSIGVVPSSGIWAYACAVAVDTSGHTNTTGEHPHLWFTQDQGQNWSALSDLPIASSAQQPLNRCSVAVDTNGNAVATVGWIVPGSSPYVQVSLSFLTQDSGKTWVQLPGHLHVYSLVEGTYTLASGPTYMIASDDTGNGNASGPPHLYRSDDGLRNWQEIDSTLTGGDGQIVAIWPGSDSAMLLVQVKSRLGLSMLQETRDGGATWTQVGPGNDALVTVLHTHRDNGLQICLGVSSTINGATQPPTIQCSHDNGQTWHSYPTPDLTATCNACGKGGSNTAQGTIADLWVAPTGTLYATVATSANSESLLTLDQQSSGWHTVATNSPISSIVYQSSGGYDAFWLFPGGTLPSAGTVGIVNTGAGGGPVFPVFVRAVVSGTA